MEYTLPAASSALPRDFFERDPREVALNLVGCLLVSRKGGSVVGGRIVEAEAYLGRDDPGSHAATKGMTARNAVMYGPPGHAYVYFTYGNHHMVNFVCEAEGTAGAVLIRALEPLWGVAVMSERRFGRPRAELTNGPGKLAAALGIDLSDNAAPLNTDMLFVYDAPRPASGQIAVSGRVGLAQGHEHEYRFFLRGNPYVSRGRMGPHHRTRLSPDRSQT